MLSWRLWQALKYPPEDHPVYQYARASHTRTVTVPIRKRKTDEPADAVSIERPAVPWEQPKRVVIVRPANSSRQTLYRVLAIFGLLWFCCCAGGGLYGIPALFLLLALGTLYGLYTAVRISGKIAEERDQGRYDLLSLTPSGALGFSWAMIMGYLYRNTTFQRLRRWAPIIAVILTVMAWGGALFFLGMALLSIPSGTVSAYQTRFSDQFEILFLIYSIAIAIAFYLDFYQSVVTSILVAIIAPTFRRNRFETQALALGGVLGVQIITYLSTLLIGFVVLPGIYNGLNVSGLLGEFVLVGLRLGVFVLVREAFIVWLRSVMEQRLNVGASDFDLVIPTPKRKRATT